MKPSIRPCAYCYAPLAGRADKRYCDSSCKSKDFRRLQADTSFESDEEQQEEEDIAPRTGGRAPQPGAHRSGDGPFYKVELQDAYARPRPGAAPEPDEQELDEDVEDEEDEEMMTRPGP